MKGPAALETKGEGEARIKEEEMVARAEFTRVGGGRMAAVDLVSAAPMALQWPEWTGGLRSEVGAFARGHADRETV
jgi:hypothetical protein